MLQLARRYIEEWKLGSRDFNLEKKKPGEGILIKRGRGREGGERRREEEGGEREEKGRGRRREMG